MIETRKAIALTAVLVFFSSILGFFAGASGLLPEISDQLVRRPGAEGPAADGGLDIKRLQRMEQYIQQEFVGSPVSGTALTEGALKGMVEATGDKYSTYFSAESYQAFLQHFEQTSFSGIGVHVELSTRTGLITVVSPIRGSPGDRAGLRPGDGIVKVNDQDVKGFALEQAVQLIRGPAGSQVKLTVQRDGTRDLLEFLITREQITVPAVVFHMVEGEPGVGYIQVREFKKRVTEDLTQAIAQLRKEGMTRLVLDLRQNGGGLLDQAIGVSSVFLAPNTPVVHIVQKGGKTETYRASGKTAFELPMVLLVDSFSASASEIVAGAIKDNGVGPLIGTKTFGKGSVQTPYNLPEGDGLKLTTAKYLTSGGHSIHEKGIDPDVAVENPKEIRLGDPGDLQLQEAIRRVKQISR